MNVATGNTAGDTDESVAFSVLIEHDSLPALQELELEALRRAQEVLSSQTGPLLEVMDRARK